MISFSKIIVDKTLVVNVNECTKSDNIKEDVELNFAINSTEICVSCNEPINIAAESIQTSASKVPSFRSTSLINSITKSGGAEYKNKYTSKTDIVDCRAFLNEVSHKLVCLRLDVDHHPLTLRTKLRFVTNVNAHNASG
jgi:hypothetical protein